MATNSSPKENPNAFTSAPYDLSRVFRHPQGLQTARSLVTMLMKTAKTARNVNISQSETVSLLVPQSGSVFDPAAVIALRELLTFSEPQHDVTGGGCATDLRDKRVEMRGRAHELSHTATAGPFGQRQSNMFSHMEQSNIGRTLNRQPLHPGTCNTASQNHLGHCGASNSLPPIQASPISRETPQYSIVNCGWTVDNTINTIEPSIVVGEQSHSLSSALGLATRHPPLAYIKPRSDLNPLSSSSPNTSPTSIKPKTATDKMAPSKKRKSDSTDGKIAKKPKTDGKRATKQKAEKQQKPALNEDIFLRIIEFCPPSFLAKARLVSSVWKDYVDSRPNSIYKNCRHENFGYDMPSAREAGLTEADYNNLLGGQKGCMSKGCGDKKASRTHWSWFKRWCQNCWRMMVEREDRVIKSRGNQYGRTVLTKMLECIPAGMHDSFLKPHDFKGEDDEEDAGRNNSPRLYKYYLTEDIERIIEQYEALTPAPYVEDPNHSPELRTAALAAHQALMDDLDNRRNDFFVAGKKKNDEHMARVKKIEAGIRTRRAENRRPHDKNRTARKELFSQLAEDELAHIPLDFVRKTKAYKAATRIYRDPGTQRGWMQLKPKIIQEWEASQGMGAASSDKDKDASRTTPDSENHQEVDDDDLMQLDDAEISNDAQTHNLNQHTVERQMPRQEQIQQGRMSLPRMHFGPQSSSHPVSNRNSMAGSHQSNGYALNNINRLSGGAQPNIYTINSGNMYGGAQSNGFSMNNTNSLSGVAYPINYEVNNGRHLPGFGQSNGQATNNRNPMHNRTGLTGVSPLDLYMIDNNDDLGRRALFNRSISGLSGSSYSNPNPNGRMVNGSGGQLSHSHSQGPISTPMNPGLHSSGRGPIPIDSLLNNAVPTSRTGSN